MHRSWTSGNSQTFGSDPKGCVSRGREKQSVAKGREVRGENLLVIQQGRTAGRYVWPAGISVSFNRLFASSAARSSTRVPYTTRTEDPLGSVHLDFQTLSNEWQVVHRCRNDAPAKSQLASSIDMRGAGLTRFLVYVGLNSSC